MDAGEAKSSNSRNKAIVKAILLLGFIGAAILVVRLTSATDYLTAEALGNFLDAAGFCPG